MDFIRRFGVYLFKNVMTVTVKTVFEDGCRILCDYLNIPIDVLSPLSDYIVNFLTNYIVDFLTNYIVDMICRLNLCCKLIISIIIISIIIILFIII